MANSFLYKDKTIKVGDTISITYKFKEADKERQQIFRGILIGVKGNDGANRMITVRKISRSGSGVERIIPLASPFLVDIKLIKQSTNQKAKIYYIRELSDSEIRHKLYQKK